MHTATMKQNEFTQNILYNANIPGKKPNPPPPPPPPNLRQNPRSSHSKATGHGLETQAAQALNLSLRTDL